jgi:hypothetical protein
MLTGRVAPPLYASRRRHFLSRVKTSGARLYRLHVSSRAESGGPRPAPLDELAQNVDTSKFYLALARRRNISSLLKAYQSSASRAALPSGGSRAPASSFGRWNRSARLRPHRSCGARAKSEDEDAPAIVPSRPTVVGCPPRLARSDTRISHGMIASIRLVRSSLSEASKWGLFCAVADNCRAVTTV